MIPATLINALTQFGVGTWVETWEFGVRPAEGYVFIVTDFRDGSRTVYVGENEDDWKQLVTPDAPGRFPTEPPEGGEILIDE